MWIKTGLVSLSLISSFVAANVSASPISPSISELVDRASSSDRSEAQNAISQLRQQGYPAVEAFWQTYQAKLPSNPQLRQALDQICQQKDCDSSRLYWYTDLEQAKAAAKLSNKPILSLRLLGNLSEEFSCANSRFFRTVLYPNSQVSQLLRDRFILHWQSVRPVPKVTIDFGDGRKLERTLTGNSIHYILDSSGRPVEAIPGLYGSQVFKDQLVKAAEIVSKTENLSESERQQFIASYHRDRLASLEAQWRKDLQKLSIPFQPLIPAIDSNRVPQLPSAELAGRFAISKSRVEIPILDRTSVTPSVQTSATRLSDTDWQRLATNYLPISGLDANSRAQVRRKLSNRDRLNYRSILRNFENSIAEDTVRNEYLFHAQIHQWFANRNSDANDLSTLNNRVYSQLFLTPSSDPWLGLLPRDVYTGLDTK